MISDQDCDPNVFDNMLGDNEQYSDALSNTPVHICNITNNVEGDYFHPTIAKHKPIIHAHGLHFFNIESYQPYEDEDNSMMCVEHAHLIQ